MDEAGRLRPSEAWCARAAGVVWSFDGKANEDGGAVMLQRLTHDLGRRLGVDRAVAFTLVARAVQMLGSTGTVLLIVHFLSPIKQGYYYTLLSLVALQVIFEVGFAVVVLQMA